MPKKKTSASASGKGRQKSTGVSKRGRISEAELEKRVNHVADLLTAGVMKKDLKREVKESYGVDARTIENYIARARDIIREETSSSREQMRAESLARYLAIIRDANSTPMEKIKAQQRIDTVFGLQAPQRVAMTDSEGNDINSEEARQQIRDRALRLLNGAEDMEQAE